MERLASIEHELHNHTSMVQLRVHYKVIGIFSSAYTLPQLTPAA